MNHSREMYGWVALMLWAAVSLASPLLAGAETVQVGGENGRIRVVFNLDKPLKPLLTQKDQSLIVNFPDTVGNPYSLSDALGIEKLLFDGKIADITLRQPFTYTGKFTEKPLRYTLDITLSQPPVLRVPIGNIQTNTTENGLTVDIYLHEDMRPEIRYLKNKRLFLIFNGDVDCTGLDRMVAKVPYLMFSGPIKVMGGTALGISLVGGGADMEVKAGNAENRLTLEIFTNGRISRSGVYAIARNSYDQGDVASVIRILKPYRNSLNEQESILLGRAYWKIAYPYYMESYSASALKYMSHGIQSMTPGTQREAFLMEYARMLVHAAQYSDAMKYIRFLKGSSSPGISAEAYLTEIDILNRKKRFQDAFVQDRQMLDALQKYGIPPLLSTYYGKIQADTLLGLGAPERALELYRKILAERPGLFTEEPGLYARMAEAAYRMGDFSTAKTCFLLAINLSRREDRPDYLISLGDCMYQLGQKDMAVGVLSQVENMAQQTESNVIAKLKTARIILEKDLAVNGRLSSKAFRQIMFIYEDLKLTKEYQEGPLGSIIKLRIAQVYAVKKDWDSALEAYKVAWTDTKKGDQVHRYAQAEAEQCIARYAAGLDAAGKADLVYDLYAQYQDTFMKGLSDPEAAFTMGRALARSGYHEQARPMLLTCVRTVSPRTEDALSWLVFIDHQRGDYAQALQWNDRYLREYPQGRDMAKMEGMRGEILYYTGRYAEALPYLEKAGKAGGERSVLDLFLLADTYGRTGNTAQEAAYLDKVLASSAPAGSTVLEQALYTRANLFRDSGDHVRAGELYRKLLSSYPQTAYREWAWFHLAEVYGRQGNQQEATKLLNYLIQRSKDKTLQKLAVNSLSGITLSGDVDEYTKLVNRFGGK